MTISRSPRKLLVARRHVMFFLYAVDAVEIVRPFVTAGDLSMWDVFLLFSRQ